MSNITIRPMEPEDWNAVSEIYLEGIATEHATFQTTCPPYTAWDAFHIKECRLVILDGGELAGWAALRRVDPRWCYRGVAEVSIYVGEKFRGRGLGSRLLAALCDESEKRDTGPYTPPFCRTTPPASASTRSAASGWWGGGSVSPGTVMAAGWTPT